MMKLCHIVAVSENNAIGVGNDLPWHVPEDLKFFKEKTIGRVLVMGRKTFESIGCKPLPKRFNILVSRSIKEAAGFHVFAKIGEALHFAKTQVGWGDEIFIVGGGEIYRETLDLVERIYLTRIHQTVAGAEVFYPEVPAAFHEVSRREGDGCTFFVFERINS